jgi:hypothetical protein
MKKLMTIALAAAIAAPAFAEDVGVPEIEEVAVPADAGAAFPHGLELGIGLSATGGVNGFVGYANKKFDSFWLKRLGLRLDLATTAPVESVIGGAIDSALSGGVGLGDGMSVGGGKLSAYHFGAMIDFYPFGDTWLLGGWRLSGGYMIGSMSMAATLAGKIDGAPSGGMEFELDGTMYKYSGGAIEATANLDYDFSGPYLGTGFDLGLFWGVKIYLDAGVVFAGKPAVVGLDIPTDNLQQSTDGGATWVAVNVPQLDADKDRALKDAGDMLAKYPYYPMLKLGLMYRF